jgi:hypothetical protein
MPRTPSRSPEPRNVRAAIVELIRTAAVWERGATKASPETRAADDRLLSEIVDLLLRHVMSLPLARVGRRTLRPKQALLAKLLPAVERELRRVQADRTTPAEAARAILKRLATAGITPRAAAAKGVERRVTAESIKAARGAKQGAVNLLGSLHIAGGRYIFDWESILATRPFGAAEVEAEARGALVGHPGVLLYALQCFGFSEEVGRRAVTFLYQQSANPHPKRRARSRPKAT